MLNLLFVAGDFNAEGGRPSGYAGKLFSKLVAASCDQILPPLNTVMYNNGGTLTSLATKIGDISQWTGPTVIVWIPNVPNDHIKLVDYIKKAYPTATLVISKNNRYNAAGVAPQYSIQEIAGRALAAHANLVIEFRKASEWLTAGPIAARVLDPLGNAFSLKAASPTLSCDIDDIGRILAWRLRQLLSYTRMRSVAVGASISVPDEPEFFELARKYAETYHNLIHANTERFLGNLSFRCERGFPALKSDNVVFVSKRNIDKREVDRSGMVATTLVRGEVIYDGDAKPSVDAPVQVSLFKEYPWAKYMLHAHVYVNGAPFTKSVLPCGVIEELDEIRAIGFADMPLPGYFAVNLRGHGSLVMSADVDSLRNIEYYARPLPEEQVL